MLKQGLRKNDGFSTCLCGSNLSHGDMEHPKSRLQNVTLGVNSGYMKKFLVLMALTGCTVAPGVGPQPTPIGDTLPTGVDDTCGAQRYHTLRGQDATALERILIMGQVRVLRPDTIATQDYRPERLNFHIDANERIERISCG